jgi:hypothetical protein
MDTRFMAAGAAGAALLATTLAAHQQTQPRPGPGSGVVTVAGTVDIGLMPPVSVTQQGEWRMAVTNAPTVVVAPLPFVKAGGRYRITWPDGATQIVTVAQAEPSGWVTVADAEATWMNLAAARSVTAVR